MRYLLTLLALLAFGCDDPAVAARAASILEHGAVEASFVCSGTWTHGNGGGAETLGYRYQASALVDGSAFVSTVSNFPWQAAMTMFYPRGSVPAEFEQYMPLGSPPGVQFFVVDGSISIQDQGGAPDDPEVISLEDADCTGFNLEAFGVEL